MRGKLQFWAFDFAISSAREWSQWYLFFVGSGNFHKKMYSMYNVCIVDREWVIPKIQVPKLLYGILNCIILEISMSLVSKTRGMDFFVKHLRTILTISFVKPNHEKKMSKLDCFWVTDQVLDLFEIYRVNYTLVGPHYNTYSKPGS